MPYLNRPEIETPPDGTVVWRYMAFESLEHLVIKKALYFSPIAKFLKDDSWEASIPKSGVEWRRRQLIEAEKKALMNSMPSLLIF